MFGPYKCALGLFTLGLPVLANADISCRDLDLKVAAHSEAHDLIVPDLNLTNPSLINDLVNNVLGNFGRVYPIVETGGTYDISATYCEPDDSNAVPGAIQLLSHGATYNKKYWTGHGLPDKKQREYYSWAHYAAKEGYASLSVDRLGAGKSTRADPLVEVHVDLSAEVLHGIVGMLKAGKIGGKKYSKVVCVGHSLGSIVAAVNAQRNVADFDALILTGWSGNLLENFAKTLTAGILPASVIDAKKWGHLHPGYVAFAIKTTTRGIFYGADGTFDPEIESYDWEHRDTFSVGELLSIYEAMNYSPFPKPVQVINGEFDAIFCSPLGRCSDDPNASPRNTIRFFEESSKFSSAFIPDAGHNLNLHYSAPDTFRVAHEFIRENLEI